MSLLPQLSTTMYHFKLSTTEIVKTMQHLFLLIVALSCQQLRSCAPGHRDRPIDKP